MLILLTLENTISELHFIILNCHISVHIHVSMNNVNMKQVCLKVAVSQSCLTLFISRQFFNSPCSLLVAKLFLDISDWGAAGRYHLNVCACAWALLWATEQMKAEQFLLTLTEFARMKSKLCSFQIFVFYSFLFFLYSFLIKEQWDSSVSLLLLCKLNVCSVWLVDFLIASGCILADFFYATILK